MSGNSWKYVPICLCKVPAGEPFCNGAANDRNGWDRWEEETIWSYGIGPEVLDAGLNAAPPTIKCYVLKKLGYK